jgi:hypothetical protein
MRRRQIFSHLNARDNRAPVPSGAGMGAATASQPDLPSPVSREEEEGKAQIWTPTTDVTAAVQVKKRGRPKGSKNRVKR